ncbi:MAG: hypothetical protein FD123_4223 [Bacteroidetes bacterium]|nr:MAG: hypothetical protein FD123_4223 [Bacteroidota bacterium]
MFDLFSTSGAVCRKTGSIPDICSCNREHVNSHLLLAHGLNTFVSKPEKNETMNTLTKTLAVIGTAFLSATALYAQNNNLVVFSESGDKFYLVLDGLKQNQKAETNVKVTGLNKDWYTAKVIFEKTAAGQKPDINQKIPMADGGAMALNKEITFSISEKKGKSKLRWGGTADIPQTPVVNPNQVVYSFNPSGDATQTTTTTTSGTNGGVGMTVNVSGMDGGMGTSTTTTTTDGGMTTTTGGTTSTTTTTTTTGTGDGVNMGVNVNGTGINVSVTGTGMGTGTTTTTQQTTTTTTTGGSSTVVNTGGGAATPQNGCMYPMSSSDFAKAKTSVQSKSFEDSKLTVAKQIMNSNCLSTSQVKDIMGLFSFEETKLDWAKFAYKKTTDPNNYFQLNDGFTFESSITELDNYIKSQH